jgi:subtilisin family serine protease
MLCWKEARTPVWAYGGCTPRGSTGRGVGIAIIDQPLLQDHVEYAGQLVRYEKMGIVGKLGSPQMHGPAMASIAVGQDCGVAPGASLHFFAYMPMSMPGNKAYCGIVDKILRRNDRLPPTERIRVISISYGMFS